MPITLNGDTGIQTPMYNGTITANAVTPSVNMKNRIINGAMVIDQRNAGASVTLVDGIYTLDRWFAAENTDGVATAQQDSSAPAGFTNSIKITTTTADATLGATQYLQFGQYIEGFNTADLNWGTANAKTITISFWVRSSLTGTFGGAVRNSADNRSYAFTYSISSANTWEQKSVTIAGDTSGTWVGATNGVGLRVIWGLGVGSTYSGTAGSWSSSLLLSATGATSVIGTLNATWYVTGVQLEVGSTATSFDYRPYTTELELCQRYLPIITGGQGSQVFANGMCYSTTAAIINYVFKVTPRTRPTGLTAVNPTRFSCSQSNTAGTACTAIAFVDASLDAAQINMTGMSTLVAGNATYAFFNAAGGQIIFTGCEL